MNKKSFFLLGPRSTGKSTLIRQQLADKALVIDLLAGDDYLRLTERPQSLEDMVRPLPQSKIVVIDEIQKIPQLLDEVHRLIETRHLTFLLTGSSARKLKAPHTNLLAGRAWVANLFPLSWCEIPQFALDRYLRVGGLPHIYPSANPVEELQAYVRTYLYEEIRAEALVRKVPAFSRFLEVAALSNGQLLNFTEIGSDAAVAPSTVREFYFVLEDTLMGFLLPPWSHSKKRKAIQTAKFYFFDVGVANHLAKIRQLDRNAAHYGHAFEHFIGMELRAFLGYSRSLEEIRFWRSVNQQEVDYVIGDQLAIEVKSAHRATPRLAKGLRALREEGQCKRYLLISQDPTPAIADGIEYLHWEQFLTRLWAGEMV